VRQIGTQALVSVADHRTDRFPLMHEVEPFVDPIERQHVGDQIVDIDLAVHVPVDDLRHVGAAARAAEGRALPYPAGYQLERPGANLLPRTGDADDDRYAPAPMTAL